MKLWHLVTNHFRMPLHRSGDASFCAGGRFMRKRTEIAATEGSVRSYLRSHLGIHVRGDPRDAINKLRVSAAEGNAEAQDMLGYMYRWGIFVKRDLREAWRLLLVAAENGFPPAEFSVGVCLSHGEGVKRDKRSALRWYRRAGRDGVAEAAYNAGYFYQNGIGIAKNEAVAKRWYRLAAVLGDTQALVNLGNLYFNLASSHRLRNHYLHKSTEFYRRAARAKNADGMYNLGLAYYEGLGTKLDMRVAIRHLTEASEHGHRSAAKVLREIRKNLAKSAKRKF